MAARADQHATCGSCVSPVEFQCSRCTAGFCEPCIRRFGEKAARILLERVTGRPGASFFGTAKIFDDQGRAFCPDCYGRLLDHSVKTGQWVIQSPDEAEPSCVRVEAMVHASALMDEEKGAGEAAMPPGAGVGRTLEATKKLAEKMPEIFDLRLEMANARKSLLEAEYLILLEPRGYGSPSEYRENCRAIMSNVRLINRVAKDLRKIVRKLEMEEPEMISEALESAARAKGHLTFWERLGF